MALRVCSLISPHSHPKGAEGNTVIVHNVTPPSDPDDEIGDEPDAETDDTEE